MATEKKSVLDELREALAKFKEGSRWSQRMGSGGGELLAGVESIVEQQSSRVLPEGLKRILGECEDYDFREDSRDVLLRIEHIVDLELHGVKRAQAQARDELVNFLAVFDTWEGIFKEEVFDDEKRRAAFKGFVAKVKKAIGYSALRKVAEDTYLEKVKKEEA